MTVKKCSFPECEYPYLAKGYCNNHYQQSRSGRPLVPVRPRAKNGQGTINDDGYRIIYKPDHPNAQSNGRISEHRWVMSETLGRPLEDFEEVHHRNGSRLDNRPENLELWVKSQPAGQRPEDLLEWAYEIIRRYGEEDDSRFSDFSGK